MLCFYMEVALWQCLFNAVTPYPSGGHQGHLQSFENLFLNTLVKILKGNLPKKGPHLIVNGIYNFGRVPAHDGPIFSKRRVGGLFSNDMQMLTAETAGSTSMLNEYIVIGSKACLWSIRMTVYNRTRNQTQTSQLKGEQARFLWANPSTDTHNHRYSERRPNHSFVSL